MLRELDTTRLLALAPLSVDMFTSCRWLRFLLTVSVGLIKMCVQEHPRDQLDCSLAYTSYTHVSVRHKFRSICVVTRISPCLLNSPFVETRRKNCVCLWNSSPLPSYPSSFHKSFARSLVAQLPTSPVSPPAMSEPPAACLCLSALLPV